MTDITPSSGNIFEDLGIPNAEDALEKAQAMFNKRDVEIDYVNHRGERAWRKVRPADFGFCPNGTPHHRGQRGWYMTAFDYGKQAYRDFKIEDIKGWKEIAPE